jgi:transposase
MKTNTKNTNKKNQKSVAQNRPEQLSTGSKPQIDFALRQANRKLETEKLLALLRNEKPDFFKLAEVVGKWVWIQFSDKQPPTVTRVLAELGFHWNKTRQTWQHPCGSPPVEAATYDPRRRYGSYFAAGVKPA